MEDRRTASLGSMNRILLIDAYSCYSITTSRSVQQAGSLILGKGHNSSRYRQLELPIRKENIQPMQEGRNALPAEKSYLGVVDPPVFSVETTFGFQYSRGNHAVQGKIRGRVNALKQ